MRDVAPMRTWCAACLALVAACCWATVQAREPGASDSYPAGVSLGTPVAINPPPGFYFINYLSYYSATLSGAQPGLPDGPRLSVTAEATKWMWSTPWKVLGATEMMFINVPVVNTGLYGVPSAMHHKLALSNVDFEPVNLSWKLGPHLYTSVMFGFYAPIGFHARATIHTGNDFWTVQPEWGLSYVTARTDLTLHLVYDVNSRNRATGYRSGDQIFADITALRTYGRWQVGAVGYYDDQVTRDSNDGRFYPPNTPLTRPEQFAMGPLVGYTRGPLAFQIYFTRDLLAREGAARGDHLWTTLTVPL